ncbi:hypothetical protein CKO_02013 [Citrobacter koseri ATCC BAA-895]|uniref:Uncharacterized protein n=1 Tax=Citrobacter koseri (strain ATCC BAA-895 / CDC 4225-83 / SGSC4696) TaxID=290338 RepID=A8AI26_CITK8|nr:hypothetical protein CKO_02013 [Citrobacter koseri ATCC BAA-895]
MPPSAGRRIIREYCLIFILMIAQTAHHTADRYVTL